MRLRLLLLAALLIALAAARPAPAHGTHADTDAITGCSTSAASDPGCADAMRTAAGDAFADELNALREALNAKHPREQAQQAVAQQQWHRDVLSRCTEDACRQQAYAARIALLRQRNEAALERAGWPRPALITRRIASIDDTRVEGALWFRGGQRRRLQLELHVDPGDRLAWTGSGPRVLLHCADPYKREGYAGLFRHEAMAHGIDFVRVRRGEALGLVMMEFELGRELPLDQDIRCSLVLTEWLLDRPATLYLVDADLDVAPRSFPL